MPDLSWAESNEKILKKGRDNQGPSIRLPTLVAELFRSKAKSIGPAVTLQEKFYLSNIFLGSIAQSKEPIYVDCISLPEIVEEIMYFDLPSRFQEELEQYCLSVRYKARNTYLVITLYNALINHQLIVSGDRERYYGDGERVILAQPFSMLERVADEYLSAAKFTAEELYFLREFAQMIHAFKEPLEFRNDNWLDLSEPA